MNFIRVPQQLIDRIAICVLIHKRRCLVNYLVLFFNYLLILLLSLKTNHKGNHALNIFKIFKLKMPMVEYSNLEQNITRVPLTQKLLSFKVYFICFECASSMSPSIL